MKIKIEDDLFEISKRLKEVDDTYFVVYDTVKKCFEVHSTMQDKNTFCFVVGSKLTCYAIEKAQKTKISRLKTLIKRVEEENLKLEEKNNEVLKNYIVDKMSAYIKYADKKSSDIDFVYKETKWV